MRSEEQVSQDFKNCTKSIDAKVENDQSPTLQNDVHFEVTLAKMGFLKTD